MADYIDIDFPIDVAVYQRNRRIKVTLRQILDSNDAKYRAADVRPVVTCAECKWWTKQEASLQGRCELLQMYPTGAWFCANGKREES